MGGHAIGRPDRGTLQVDRPASMLALPVTADP
jgi:hypothetical protein